MKSMTQTRISSSLEAIIAQTLFRLKREAIVTSYRDRLAIELLSNRATFAFQLLEILVGECGINVILRRVERAIAANPIAESDSPERHIEALCGRIADTVATPCISTVHILQYIVSDPTTAISAELRNYGILPEDIGVALQRLTA